MLKPSVFISRDLETNSIFKTTLEKQKYTISGLSFVRFQGINFELPTNEGWLFFYSKRGVDFFFRAIQTQNLPDFLKKNWKWAALGKATAKKLLQYIPQVDYEGTGDPQMTAEGFKKLLDHRPVYFIQAQHSKQSIQKLLHFPSYSKAIIVYKNTLRKNILKRDENILVFTSPLNVNAYFSIYNLNNYQKVLAIGKTTAKALENQNVSAYKIAEKPYELDLADAVVSLF